MPRHARGARQTKQRQGNRRTPIRPNGARAIAGHPPRQAPAGANSRHNSASRQAPEQSQDTRRANTHRGKLPPQLRQADRRQGKRKALARPNSARASAGHPPGQATPRQAPAEQTPTEASSHRTNPSGQAAPDHAPPGIQTEIASLNGDRRFQLQRSGTISSGPLKKLRVSCVHERDGKQVPCVRSLCSYARESRAC